MSQSNGNGTDARLARQPDKKNRPRRHFLRFATFSTPWLHVFFTVAAVVLAAGASWNPLHIGEEDLVWDFHCLLPERLLWNLWKLLLVKDLGWAGADS